jgi:hypothetical protein
MVRIPLKDFFKLDVLMTAHNEGEMLKRTFRSARTSIEYARTQFPFEYEFTINLDNPDAETVDALQDLVKEYSNLIVTYSNFNDVSKVRNQHILSKQDGFLAFIDADDYWCLDWILKFSKLRSKDTTTIYHPEVTFFFDNSDLIIHKSNSNKSIRKLISRLIVENIWTSSFIAHRRLFDDNLFKSGSTSHDTLFAYEDWSFFRDSLKRRVHHKTIKNTYHFHTKRIDSNTNKTDALKKMPHPFDL